MTKKDGLLMVLDAGSGGGRCLLLDASGREVAFTYRPWTMKVPPDNPMGSVFDPEEWWGALVDAGREALSRAGGGEVLAVSATSLRDGAVFLGNAGEELCCGTNRDGRAIGYGFEMAQNHGELHWRTTGRWPLGLDAAARLIWYRREQPEAFARIRRILMVSDWVVWRLSGEAASEPTNASSAGLFDMEKGAWSADLAQAYGIDPAVFPGLRWPGEIVGRLRPAAAEAFGLPTGIPVVAGAGDTQAGCLGSGAWAAGDTTAVAGTTAPVMQILDEPKRDETKRTFLGAYVAPGKWAAESNAGMTGTAYAWFVDTFVGGSGAYDTMEKEVAEAAPAQVMAWLGPQVADFSMLKFPSDSAVKFPPLGVFCTPTRGMLGRAVLENVCYALKANLDQLPEKPALLRACGGQTRSATFVGILAAVCGLPVAVPEVREATGAGAAVAAAVGAGVYGNLEEAAERMVRLATVEPDPALVGQYAGKAETWVAGF